MPSDETRLPDSSAALATGHIPGLRKPFQTPPALALRQFLRRNLLIAISAALFLAAIVLLLVQIDRVYYYQAKTNVIRDLLQNERILADPSREVLNDSIERYTQRYLQRRPELDHDASDAQKRLRELEHLRLEEQRQTDLPLIRERAANLLQQHPYVFRVEFLDSQNNPIVVVEEPSRLRTQNNWQNCLFIQRFEQRWTTVKFLKEGGRSVPVAVLAISLTTPHDIPEIEELTRRWRLRSALIVLGIVLFYALILWKLLLPVRNVIKALDKGAQIGSPLIPRPGALLEKYYNNLARDATLSIYSTGLRDLISAQNLVDLHPLMEFAPRLLTDLFPVSDAQLWSFRRNDLQEHWIVDARYDGIVAGRRELDGVLLERVNTLRPGDAPDSWGGTIEEYQDDDGRTHAWYAAIVNAAENSIVVLVVHLAARRYGSPSWWRDLLGDIAREIGYAMRTVAEQRRLILQEKSKANISLSRNIGHDLTNIIATSKLDLMTVKALLEVTHEDMRNDPARQQIFRESLEALLNNTRFLQEIVNLYRSFSYLSRPKFETVNANDVVAEVCTLFALSLSRAIRIDQDLDPALAPIELEPRLIRLALFNLLSNAADSIKRSSTAENPDGLIVIRTRQAADGAGVEIRVEDSGGGIRDRDGRLLEPHEIDAIFQLGYSTKEKDSAEGLGLNWVQQIVHDFHGGDLAGGNRSEGGACFRITLSGHGHRPVAPAPDLLSTPLPTPIPPSRPQ